MREKQLVTMTRWAEPYLEPGESLRLAVWGPNSAIKYMLGTAKGRVVAITDRNVYVFGSSIWGRMSKPTGLVAKHAIGSAAITIRGWRVTVGEERMVVHLHFWSRARELSGLANAI